MTSRTQRWASRLVDRARANLAAGPRVWTVIVLIWIAASAAAVITWSEPGLTAEYSSLVFFIMPAIFLAETFPVHLQFRSEATSFSLIEIPMVMGLLLIQPSHLIIAVIVGGTLSLALVRRLPAVKLAFNIANLVLQASVAIWTFRLLNAGTNPYDWSVSVSAIAASFASSVLGIVMINTVIYASEGSYAKDKLANSLLFACVVGIANASLGLIAVILFQGSFWSLVLLAIPLGILFLSYRAFASERSQREQVEFLYSATKSLQANDEREEGIETLVREAATMFRASQVELLLFAAADGSTPAVSYRIGALDGLVERIVDPPVDLAVRAAAELPDATLIGPDAAGVARDYLDKRGATEGIVTALGGDGKVIGLLAVADRLGTVSAFGEEDVRLFETLAYHASTALENDRLGQALVQLRTLERELSHLATHDPLTGLPNRLRLRQHLDRLTTETTDIELMFIDLDDFKFVNDTFGHAAGDELLREVGRRISSCLRNSDIAARLGGDEFAVVVQPAGHAMTVADRIIEAIATPMDLDGKTIAIGCSIGVAKPDGSTATAHLLRQADVAMYAAKNSGKGRVALYSPDLGEELAMQQEMQQQVRAAMASDQLRVHYQPIYDLHSRRIVGAEALVRWNHEDGIRVAESFLSVAEESGLVTQIDRWVFQQVLDNLAALSDGPGAELWHSVNLSVRHLQEDDVVDFVLNSVQDSGVDPSRIVIEVTETAAMQDIDANIAKLEQLSEAGLTIALDDFGTGFSSISHLRRLPVDYLKIARPFVADLGGSGGDPFIRAIVNLGQTLGLAIVAEGIERTSELRELRVLGCDMGQGFLLDRPMTATHLRERIEAEAVASAPVAVG